MNLAFSIGYTGGADSELQENAISITSIKSASFVALNPSALYRNNLRRICGRVKEYVLERMQKESFTVFIDLTECRSVDVTSKETLDAMVEIRKLLSHEVNDTVNSVTKVVIYAPFSSRSNMSLAVSTLLCPTIPTEVHDSIEDVRQAFLNYVTDTQSS